jgi:hypothetical protein
MLTGRVRIDGERGGALPYDRVVTEAIAFTPFESYLDREQLADVEAIFDAVDQTATTT